MLVINCLAEYFVGYKNDVVPGFLTNSAGERYLAQVNAEGKVGGK